MSRPHRSARVGIGARGGEGEPERLGVVHSLPRRKILHRVKGKVWNYLLTKQEAEYEEDWAKRG